MNNGYFSPMKFVYYYMFDWENICVCVCLVTFVVKEGSISELMNFKMSSAGTHDLGNGLQWFLTHWSKFKYHE